MKIATHKAFKKFVVLAIYILLCSYAPATTMAATNRANSETTEPPVSVFEATAYGIRCRAGGENASHLAGAAAASGEERRAVARGNNPHAGGLTIILRSTAQLNSFPAAKAAYRRAADRWEAAIRTPITIVIDVFFLQLPPEIAGFTQPQFLYGDNIYPEVRSGLISGASNGSDLHLYLRTPQNSLPTDIGAAADGISTSANFRALGMISPVADPVGERPFFGRPPLIGLNAFYPWDFDPTDGIDADKLDFDGVVVHEMGHILGFVSSVGDNEFDPNGSVRPTVLDMFRFRPGITLPNFPSQNRILSSGGDQIFYGMGPRLPLSTGRADGSGGDGAQAGHWQFQWPDPEIGVMTPFVDFGWRLFLTHNDLVAFDTIGYTVDPSVLGGP